MRRLALVALTLAWMGSAAYAQPQDDHKRPAGNNNHAPAAAAPHPAAAPNRAPAAPAPRVMPAAAPNRGPAPNNRPAPSNAMRGPAPSTAMRGPAPGRAGGHRLPPGIAVPTAHHSAPSWHGRSWAVGDNFIMTGFDGPSISDWTGYGLTSPRRGTHWIYVDGWYLMIGNRTGRIFAEIPADY